MYRDSPGKTYARSPIRNAHELLEEEIHLKSALRNEAEVRRLVEQISLLQLKLRKSDEIEIKCESLIKQNSLLAQENDHLARELTERKFELDRYRASSSQLQERDALKVGQISELNHALGMEIDLLKKERFESGKLYEAHIQKLESMLEEKIRENQMLGAKVDELLNSKEVALIHFEEEKNKLKNLIARTSHDLERELQYTKERQESQKLIQIDTLKKNHLSQVSLLEDEIDKLKSANSYKGTEFEAQLNENRQIRRRYQEQVKSLIAENDSLRARMHKLEEINRSEVEKIQGKYADIHYKGTSDLKEQHGREIKQLSGQIDRLSWLLGEKNTQIQNLVRDKREQRNAAEERERTANAEIDSLKSKLALQQQKDARDAHQLLEKVSKLEDKLLRDAEANHDRAKGFRHKISDLEAQVKLKQGHIDQNKDEAEVKEKELLLKLEETDEILYQTKTSLQEVRAKLKNEQISREKQARQAKETQAALARQVSELEVSLEASETKAARLAQNSESGSDSLKNEIKILKESIQILERKLSQALSKHNQQLSSLNSNSMDHLEKLQKVQRKSLEEAQKSYLQELNALRSRIDIIENEKKQMRNKLVEYIQMFEGLKKFFAEPHEGEVNKEKSQGGIYEVLSKVAKSTIHIF